MIRKIISTTALAIWSMAHGAAAMEAQIPSAELQGVQSRRALLIQSISDSSSVQKSLSLSAIGFQEIIRAIHGNRIKLNFEEIKNIYTDEYHKCATETFEAWTEEELEALLFYYNNPLTVNLVTETTDVVKNSQEKYLKIGVSLYNTPFASDQYSKNICLETHTRPGWQEYFKDGLRIYEGAISSYVRQQLQENNTSLLEWDGVIENDTWQEILSCPDYSSKYSDSIFNDQQRENIVSHAICNFHKDLCNRYKEATHMAYNIIDKIGHEKIFLYAKKIIIWEENARPRLQALVKKAHDEFIQSPEGRQLGHSFRES